jgi:hypothetical protein
MRAMMTMMAAREALTATTEHSFQAGDRYCPIQSVIVVDIDALTPTTQAEIYATAARATRAEFAALHEAIETSPMAVEALAEISAEAADIIAADVDRNGALTLVANRGV